MDIFVETNTKTLQQIQNQLTTMPDCRCDCYKYMIVDAKKSLEADVL